MSSSIMRIAAMGALCALIVGGGAFADSELLGTKLTPMGADPSASVDGVIPAWTGGFRTPPADYMPGQPHIDPFADDERLFTISHENLNEYAERLPATQIELLTKFAGKYVLNVYPTRRSCAFPNSLYAANKRNADKAQLVKGGVGFTGAWGGVAFPVPQNADEVLWNFKTHFNGRRYSAKITGGNMYENGIFTRIVREDKRYSFYYDPETTAFADLKNSLFIWLGIWSAPPAVNGSGFSMTNTIDQIAQPRPGFMFSPDTRKIVRPVPNATSYEAPMMTGDGLRIADDMMLFSGSQDRYTWKMKGKKTLYIPYNVYRATDPATGIKNLVKRDFLNPEFIRYELHRVWVIEGILKPGFSHRYSRRVMYFDEDTWIAVGTDLYDEKGTLTHGQIGFIKNYYEYPACIQDFDIKYDLVQGRYNIDNLKIEFGPANLDDERISSRSFGSAALKRAVGR